MRESQWENAKARRKAKEAQAEQEHLYEEVEHSYQLIVRGVFARSLPSF